MSFTSNPAPPTVVEPVAEPELLGPKGHARVRGGWLGAMVVVLLAAFAFFSYSASLSKGVSFDEGLQLAVGYDQWLHGDYRQEGANGDFIKRWATLPYLITRPRFVATEELATVRGDPYDLGRRFLFELGNDPAALLRQSRAMVVVLGVLTGLLVFWFAGRVFGPTGGLVALILYVTSPHLLAFSAIVSTDLSITFTLFGSTICVWLLLHRVSVGRLAASLLFFGLLLLAKMTAVAIFPIAACLLAIRWVRGGPLRVSWRRREWMITSRRGQAAVFGGLIGLHALAGAGAIWAHYGFRYAAISPGAESAAAAVAPRYPDRKPGPIAPVVRWVNTHRLLPEGYCRGVEFLLGHDDAEPAFMNGRVHRGGWRSFFPYAIWAKTQPALFLALALAAAGLWSRVRRTAPPAAKGADTAEWGAAAVLPHLVLVVVYLGFAVMEDLNIGHRHVLPIYPSLFVLAGAVVWLPVRRAAWAELGLCLLLAWRGLDVLATWPHYLAYFAPQVGGPPNGYKHLVDSSLDWGMDLPQLKEWLEVNNPGYRDPLFLSYFGTDSVRRRGIKATMLPSFRPRREIPVQALKPGIYAISATQLHGNYLPTPGQWNPVYEQIYQAKLRSVRLMELAWVDPARSAELLRHQSADFWRGEYRTYDFFRFGRLCAWLRRWGEPPEQVGYSILIWRLSLADLEAALNGPPPELGELPAFWPKMMNLRSLDNLTGFQVVVGGTPSPATKR